MSSKLDFVQSVVEKLYYETAFKDILAVEDGEDICTESCSCELLKDRIKNSLRTVLCDLITLRTIRERGGGS